MSMGEKWDGSIHLSYWLHGLGCIVSQNSFLYRL